jgi:Mn2+/Fe2+ NRAMP family transporter
MLLFLAQYAASLVLPFVAHFVLLFLKKRRSHVPGEAMMCNVIQKEYYNNTLKINKTMIQIRHCATKELLHFLGPTHPLVTIMSII